MQSIAAPIVSAELRRRFVSSTRVFVLTGAGVSAESGVPTFRGGCVSAVWKGRRSIAADWNENETPLALQRDCAGSRATSPTFPFQL